LALSHWSSPSSIIGLFFPTRTKVTLNLKKLIFNLMLCFVFCLYEYFLIDKEWDSHPCAEKQEQYGRTPTKNISLQDRKQYNNNGSEYPSYHGCNDGIWRFDNLWNICPNNCSISNTKCESEHYETYKNENKCSIMHKIENKKANSN